MNLIQTLVPILWGVSIVTACTSTLAALAVDLENPPAAMCLSREGKEQEIQDQLVDTEVVLYNWKTTQGNIINLMNGLNRGDLSLEQVDEQMTIEVSKLKELSDLLDKKVSELRNINAGEDGSVLHLSDVILAQKEAGLKYLTVITGSNDIPFEKATEQYDSTWMNFVQSWNMTYGMFGCTSTNP